MPHVLNSTRFGRLEIAESSVIRFPDGLVGLDGSRFVLLSANPARDPAPTGAFAWLHSLDDAALALPVTRPQRFFPEYVVELDEHDAPAGLRALEDPDAAEIWVTVRAAARLEEFVANLRAPIVVAGGQGWQVLNAHRDAALRVPLGTGAVAPGPAPAPVRTTSTAAA